jgi:hypothetical protein
LAVDRMLVCAASMRLCVNTYLLDSFGHLPANAPLDLGAHFLSATPPPHALRQKETGLVVGGPTCWPLACQIACLSFPSTQTWLASFRSPPRMPSSNTRDTEKERRHRDAKRNDNESERGERRRERERERESERGTRVVGLLGLPLGRLVG